MLEGDGLSLDFAYFKALLGECARSEPYEAVWELQGSDRELPFSFEEIPIAVPARLGCAIRYAAWYKCKSENTL